MSQDSTDGRSVLNDTGDVFRDAIANADEISRRLNRDALDIDTETLRSCLHVLSRNVGRLAEALAPISSPPPATLEQARADDLRKLRAKLREAEAVIAFYANPENERFDAGQRARRYRPL